MSYLLGIDLGTTNSLGCVYRDGQVCLIPNQYGSYLTPSVVSADEQGEILVGEIARERLITHPERTISSFKRFMGEDKKIVLGEKCFTPEELSSFVIRSIVEDGERFLGEKIEEVIISVPAYFHDQQRYATKKAGLLAGVSVKRLINEPSAAAMASYMDNGEEELSLVFDFGGGTLDVSIVDCFENVVEIDAVSGDNHLGGDDFHEVMVDSFLREHGISRDSISGKELAVLRRQAELCKRALTSQEQAQMEAWIQGTDYVSQYTNKRLLQESSTIFYKIRQVLNAAMKSAQINPEQISKIILAGGSSCMPIVRSYVTHLFQREPEFHIRSDEMIVRGLGYLCGVKAREASIRDYVLTDICPFSLGNSVLNESDPENPYFSPVIPRNSVLPCSRVHRYYTARDGQKQVEISVLQGEHPYARDNRELARYTIPVPAGPAGKEAVDVRFTYDIDGILIADIQVISTGQTFTKVVSQTMDDKELERRMAELEKLKLHPRNMNENKLLISRLQTLYEEASPEGKAYLGNMLRVFESVLEEQDPRKIKRYRNAISESIANMSPGEFFDEEAFWAVYQDFQDSEEGQEQDGDGEGEDKEEESQDRDFMEYEKKWIN